MVASERFYPSGGVACWWLFVEGGCLSSPQHPSPPTAPAAAGRECYSEGLVTHRDCAKLPSIVGSRVGEAAKLEVRNV
jgi:hypothetical protein